jgi:hypothetical protein
MHHAECRTSIKQCQQHLASPKLELTWVEASAAVAAPSAAALPNWPTSAVMAAAAAAAAASAGGSLRFLGLPRFLG